MYNGRFGLFCVHCVLVVEIFVAYVISNVYKYSCDCHVYI